MEVTKGDTLKITKEARPFQCGGIRSATNDLPREEEIVTVRKVTKTKRGPKAHVHNGEYGYAIYIKDMPDFMNIEKMAA